MFLVGFEPTNSACERPQTNAFRRRGHYDRIFHPLLPENIVPSMANPSQETSIELRTHILGCQHTEFRHILKVVFVLMGNLPAPEFYVKTFRNNLAVRSP
jgi:hypothetical protein